MQIHADLHIHSHFSIGTSRMMDLPLLVTACRRKGIHALGSGDALHPTWRERCATFEGDGEEIVIIPTAEVEDQHRIHHLILMEDFEKFDALAEMFAPLSRTLVFYGRPRVAATGEVIASLVHRLGGLIGPAHAFTPWTSLYARYNSLAECYGREPIDFLELGLSADTSYGACVVELTGIPFLSNSDAHSPDLVKIGREWNCLEVSTLTSSGVLESVRRHAVTYNAGLFPEEGKYNRTACSRCYRQYPLEEALDQRWRCRADGGRIKKGVADRVKELTRGEVQVRPPYHHTIPLREIIQKVLGTSSPSTRRCQNLHTQFLTSLGTEIEILMERTIGELQEVDEQVAEAIAILRTGDICLHPGGGGRYGTFSFKKRKGYCSHSSH